MDKQLAQQLSELKTQMAAITEAISRIDQKVHEPEPECQVPEWIRLAADDSVPLQKVLQAAQVWDQDDFESWTNNWNSTKIQRIQLLTEALAIWEAEVASRKLPTTTAQISTVEQAQALMDKINAYKKLQQSLVDYVRNCDRTPLVVIQEKDHYSDFRAYYNWVNSFVEGVAQLKPECEVNYYSDRDKDPLAAFYAPVDPGVSLYNQTQEVLHHLLAQIDLDMIPPLKMIDPETFEIVEAPVPKNKASVTIDPVTFQVQEGARKSNVQSAHKKRQYETYKKSLKKAFEYLKSQDN